MISLLDVFPVFFPSKLHFLLFLKSGLIFKVLRATQGKNDNYNDNYIYSYYTMYKVLKIILTQVNGRDNTTTIKTTTVANDIVGITFRRI